MKKIICAMLITIIIPGILFSQGNSWGSIIEFNLGTSNYKYEDGNWYKYNAEKRKDKIYPSRLIVKKKNGDKLSNSDLSSIGVKGINKISKKLYGNYYVVSINKDKDPFSIAEQLFQDSSFEYVEFDAFMKKHSDPNDYYWNNTYVHITGQWNLKSNKLNMPQAWDITKGNNSIILAVIDDGVELTHSDLQGNLWSNIQEVQGQSGVDDDDNGYIDDLHGWHFKELSGDNNISGGTHGTEVSGIAVARSNDNNGIAGIAGGWDITPGVQLMVLKYEDIDTDEYDELFGSTVAQCIQYAAENGADVINMSLGSDFTYEYIEQQIDNATNNYNCICIASSGNFSLYGESQDVEFPANYSKVISVGASDFNDNWLYEVVYGIPIGSCWDMDGGVIGGKEIDLLAPEFVITTDNSNDYIEFRMTSAAAPHVSGVVSLIRSINNNLTYAQVRTILSNTSTNSPTWESHYGYGRINAYLALKYTLENYGGTIGGIGKTVTFHEDITIASGVTLTIKEGTAIVFENDSRLLVNGTLNVNGTSSNKVTFNFGSPTNYNGIKFYYGSSGTIDYAIIKNAFYGVYLMNSTPTVKNCEIFDCSFGIQSYYNSPTIETNEIYDITNYGIYAYSGSPTITDNYIHDTGSYGVALNATTDTYIRKNSIKKCDGGVFAWGNQSSIKMIGYSGNYYGLNEIEDYENEHGVLITGGTADLGVYGGSSYKYGYNNIIKNVGSVVKNSTSSMILAEKNYWGGTPVVTWFTGDVSWIKYLSSPYTSSGSSLDLNKIINVEPDKLMLYEASELTDSKSYNLASNMYKQLISEYPDSRYGGLALAWSMTSQKLIKDLETQRDYLQNQTTHKNERVRNSAILWLQTLEAEAGNKEAADKVVNTTSIKEIVGVEIRLNWANDLLNIYNDEKSAEVIFNELTKADATESTLFTIAAIKSTALNFKETEYAPKSENINNNVEEIVVSETKLNASYPNPFNPTATISYQLQYKSHVSLIVYNSIGQVVVELVNQQKEKGIYNVDFDASDLSSGLYIYRLQVNTPDGKGSYVNSKKMILLK